MITADTITDEQIEQLIRETPAAERTLTQAMTFLVAQGKSPGPCFRLPTADEQRRERARCAEIFNARTEAK